MGVRYFCFQNDLPKPPVPSLKHTLGRYLEYASVVANSDEAKLSHTIKAIDEFQKNFSAKLQKKLENIANVEDNWVCFQLEILEI